MHFGDHPSRLVLVGVDWRIMLICLGEVTGGSSDSGSSVVGSIGVVALDFDMEAGASISIEVDSL